MLRLCLSLEKKTAGLDRFDPAGLGGASVKVFFEGAVRMRDLRWPVGVVMRLALSTVIFATMLMLAARPAGAGTVCDPQQSSHCVKPDSAGNTPVTLAPSAASSNGVASVHATAAVTSKVIKASAGNWYDAYVATGAVAGYAIALDAASDPGNGALTGSTVIGCQQVQANSQVGWAVNGAPPVPVTNGLVIVFSTTGCFTETQSATAYISGRVK